MKKQLHLSFLLLAMGAVVFAQDKTEVMIKVKKDGKVVKDTVYTFEDAKEAKHAISMLDAVASNEMDLFFHEEGDMKNLKLIKEGDKAGKMIILSEDGEIIKELEGDHLKWVTESADGKKMKVMVKELDDEELEKDGKKVIKKEVIVYTDEEDGDGKWTIMSDGENEDVEVIVVKKVKGEGDEEEVKVKVIKKEKELKEKQMKEEKMKKEQMKKEQMKKEKK